MRKILLLIITLGALSFAVGFYFWNKPVSSLEKAKADEYTTATELMSAFEDSEAAANDVYLGKIVEVTGSVKGVNFDEDGTARLILATESMMGDVSCSFRQNVLSREKAMSLPGQAITVKGECTGYLMDVVLERCVLIN